MYIELNPVTGLPTGLFSPTGGEAFFFAPTPVRGSYAADVQFRLTVGGFSALTAPPPEVSPQLLGLGNFVADSYFADSYLVNARR